MSSAEGAKVPAVETHQPDEIRNFVVREPGRLDFPADQLELATL
jgi:hypothetical protein